MSLADLQFANLSRWQRMRFVVMGLAGGIPIDNLLLTAGKTAPSKSSQQSPTDSADDDACCCEHCGRNFHMPATAGSGEEGREQTSSSSSSPSTVIRLPFAHPGRSLVDKHFDALSQAMSDVGVLDWGVSGAGGGDLDVHLPCGVTVVGEDDQHNSNNKKKKVCFSCALAQLANSPAIEPTKSDVVVVMGGNSSAKKGNDGDTDAKETASPWWWSSKYEPDYVNMDTGDIGPMEPADDLIVKPLSSWSENCRWLLRTTAERLYSREQQQQQVEQKEGGSAEATSSSVFGKMASVFSNDNINVVVSIQSSSSSSSSSPLTVSFKVRDAATVIPSAGFNRTKVEVSDDLKKNLKQVIRTPLEYSLLLFRSMLQIVMAYSQHAVGTDEASSSSSSSSEEIAAALVPAIFSDARRRQTAATSQQGMMMMPGGGGGGGGMSSSPAAGMLMGMLGGAAAAGGGGALAGVGGLPGMMAMPGGGSGKPSVEEMIDMMKAQQQQQQQASGAVAPPVQQQPAPAPPFSLPLSMFEELLVVSSSKSGENDAVFSSASRALLRKISELREKVELSPDDGLEDEDGNFVPKPTYTGEFSKAVHSACSS